MQRNTEEQTISKYNLILKHQSIHLSLLEKGGLSVFISHVIDESARVFQGHNLFTVTIRALRKHFCRKDDVGSSKDACEEAEEKSLK